MHISRSKNPLFFIKLKIFFFLNAIIHRIVLIINVIIINHLTQELLNYQLLY